LLLRQSSFNDFINVVCHLFWIIINKIRSLRVKVSKNHNLPWSNAYLLHFQVTRQISPFSSLAIAIIEMKSSELENPSVKLGLGISISKKSLTFSASADPQFPHDQQQ
jgi:hypothetical protein